MHEENSFNHPTKDIIGEKSQKIKGKSICLCLTGSVGIVNSPHVARGLMRHGAEVFSVMTPSACDLIQPQLMFWSTGNPVITKITGSIEHIAMAGEKENSKGQADLVLICPITANTIAKIAHGISDNAVTAISTVALGSKTPIVMVPSMHDSMFRNPIVQNNIQKLKDLGIIFLGPRLDENKAKVANPEDVVNFVANYMTSKQDLIKKRFMITTGPTREWIDDVRFISNPASGRTGMLIAENIISRGGEVCILNGISTISAPIKAKIINLSSTQDFVDKMTEELKQTHYDVLISTAALADFTPKEKVNGKISSDNLELQIKLKSTPKLINKARELDPHLFIVAFKAEPKLENEKLIKKAFERLQSANANLIVANNVNLKDETHGFASKTNEVYIIDQNKEVFHIPLTTKNEIAIQLVDYIQKRLE
ncbi:MAG: bifunctional phosphopantothenoylcysteine decarboxylase/phosphopantothenate--cysteine ligase CoaBC [Promethearchaeota archaeon]